MPYPAQRGSSVKPSPLIDVIDGFAAQEDCRRMIREADRGNWFRSTVESNQGQVSSAARTSESLYLSAYSSWAASWLKWIESRLADLFGVEPSHLEPWQMARYRRGGRYDYHLDSGAWRHHPSGQRSRTILMVLQAPKRGGATHFRALDQTVRPREGRLVTWHNLLESGECNHAMIHAACPVWQGTKIILLTWEHERPYLDT